MYTITDQLRDYVEPSVTSEPVTVLLLNPISAFISYLPLKEGEEGVEEVATHTF